MGKRRQPTVAQLKRDISRLAQLALDAADVIRNEGFVDPEDDEDADFRRIVAGIVKASGLAPKLKSGILSRCEAKDSFDESFA